MSVGRHNAPRQFKAPYNLSPHEVRVLGFIVEGMSNAEIADRLYVGVRAVEKICTVIYDKLGLSARGNGVHGAVRVQAAVKWVREQEFPVAVAA